MSLLKQVRKYLTVDAMVDHNYRPIRAELWSATNAPLVGSMPLSASYPYEHADTGFRSYDMGIRMSGNK